MYMRLHSYVPLQAHDCGLDALSGLAPTAGSVAASAAAGGLAELLTRTKGLLRDINAVQAALAQVRSMMGGGEENGGAGAQPSHWHPSPR